MDKIKILLAEDDLFLRDIYQEILEGEGFLLTLATNGEEALMQLQNGGWDLVLLDDIMPKFTGVQVLEKISSKDRHVLAKVIIFLTNIDNPEEIKKLDSLADGHLLKSNMSPPHLIEKIKSLLGIV